VDVAVWLRGLGLEQYESAFRENDIDAELLSSLTGDDLKEIGVASIGHRRKMADAIALLRAYPTLAGTPSSEATMPAATSMPSKPARAASERRQLTVMFVDLVGSTALSCQLDPEEMREILQAYHKAVAEEIARLQGHIAKLMGDGVLCYFGWPRAHEDEVERAVRAGLAVVQAVGRLRTPSGDPLVCRAGIATGLVVVGDLIGVGAAQEEAVVGETPNLAARLQQLAEPGAVIIAEATRQLLGASFIVEALDRAAVKGMPAPVSAFRVVAERVVESRFAARVGEAVAPMVGRDEDLALLMRQWRLASDGEGQAVVVAGEAGIGKSRLVQALRDRLAQETPTVLLYQGSPFHTGSPLWPTTRQLALAAGFAPADDAAGRLTKLAELFRQAVADEDEPLALLAPLLGLAVDPDPLAGLAPQERRTRTIKALVDQLLGLARRRPVLMLFEDIHWFDPTSLALVQSAIDAIGSARVLLVLTTRPEDEPALGSRPHLSRLPLHRLGRAAAERIIGRIVAAQALPDRIRDEILARTDGVPLFIEEITKAVLEAAPAPGGVFVPATLQDSLLARLDREPAMKAVAQVAACVGREFDHRLLSAVADVPSTDLGAGLDGLVGAELVFRHGNPPDATYSFKHALVRDAAYQSLLKERRRQIHAAIAHWLVENRPDADPGFLGQHAAAGGLHRLAAETYLAAADLAARRWAPAEAVSQARKGLAALEKISDGDDVDDLALGLQELLARMLIHTRGFSDDETGAAYEAAQTVAIRTGASVIAARLSFGEFLFRMVRGNLGEAKNVAQRMLAAAEDLKADALRAMAHRAIGFVLLYMGNPGAARGHLSSALDYAEGAGQDLAADAWVFDPVVTMQLGLGHAEQLAGNVGAADKAFEAAISRSIRLGHRATDNVVHHNACFFELTRGNPSRVAFYAAESIGRGEQHGGPYRVATARIYSAWAKAGDQRDDSLGELDRGLAEWRATGARLWLPVYLGLRSDLAMRLGRLDEADRDIAEALAMASTTGEIQFVAELHRRRGTLALARSRPEEAAAAFGDALAVAREHGHRIYELRATSSLARLWAERGERGRAQGLLAPICGWFTEGADMVDLVDARNLLGTLS
jgi:class 3 adenylate cyclase/tetratricopeptide (TPR) repeat protein